MDRPSDSGFDSSTEPEENDDLQWLREHPTGFFIAANILHRATCPGGLPDAETEASLFGSLPVADEAIELEGFAMQYLPQVTFCRECTPPSAYFDTTELNSWERPPPSRGRRRRENCRSLPRNRRHG